MFTRNYWIYRYAEFANKKSEIATGSTTKPPYITITGEVAKDVYGSNSYKGNNSISIDYISNYTLDYVKNIDYVSTILSGSSSDNTLFSCGVFFGSGTTPATIDDYKLEGTIATNFTHSMIDVSERSEDGSYSIMGRTYTITNNNDTDMVIGEIGIFYELRYKTSSSSSSGYQSYPYLIERTVLESPITIPANGGVGQVTYKIRMDFPVPDAT